MDESHETPVRVSVTPEIEEVVVAAGGLVWAYLVLSFKLGHEHMRGVAQN
jgi:hypothetical protein